MSSRELRLKLKKEAKETFNENKLDFIISNLIVAIVYFIPIILSKIILISFKLKLLTNILIMLIAMPLVVGLNNIYLERLKGRNIKFKEILSGYKILYQVYGTMLSQLFIAFILTIPFIFIPIFLIKDISLRQNIVKFIINISSLIFYIIFSQVKYVIADIKDISIIDAIKKSISIVKPYIWDFILLLFSFTGWIFFILITFGLAYIWIGPYIKLTFANFYVYIKEGKLNNYRKYEKKEIKFNIILVCLFCIYMAIESNVYQSILTPIVIKNVIKENDLKLVNFNEEKNYYISEEEGLKYRIERNYNNLSDLIKYTVVVKNHCLDIKKNDNIQSTIIYIIANGDRILGISCDPNNKNVNIKTYNPIPGKFDINGKFIK